jgi:hypothetical protein
MEVCPLSRPVMSFENSTGIHLVTRRRSLSPSSFTRSAISVSYDSLSPKGTQRAYHVPGNDHRMIEALHFRRWNNVRDE